MAVALVFLLLDATIKGNKNFLSDSLLMIPLIFHFQKEIFSFLSQFINFLDVLDCFSSAVHSSQLVLLPQMVDNRGQNFLQK